MSKSRRAPRPDEAAPDDEADAALLRFRFSDVFDAHLAPPSDDAPVAPRRPTYEVVPSRAGRWYITMHASWQFRERFFPDVDTREVIARLVALSGGASRVPGAEKADGKRTYAHPDYPQVRFIVAHDDAYGRHTLVTVIDAPRHHGHKADYDALRRRGR